MTAATSTIKPSTSGITTQDPKGLASSDPLHASSPRPQVNTWVDPNDHNGGHATASSSSPHPHPHLAGGGRSDTTTHAWDDSDEDHIGVYMRKWPFVAVWWFALLCHCACAGFLCSTTAIYVFLGGINMMYYNKLLGSTLRNEMASLGYVFVGIAALHFLEILRMLWFTVRARRLTFNEIPSANPKASTAVVLSVPVSVAAQAGKQPVVGDTAIQAKLAKQAKHHHHQRAGPLPALLRRLSRPLQVVLHVLQPPPRVMVALKRIGRFLGRVKTKLTDRKTGLLGLESPYFNFLFLFRESVEIASQSYQMYQCSMFITSAWINNLFLIITVLNCWSTPILQHALARFNALERVICLTLDGLLDAGTCMVIPLAIVIKYVVAFDNTLLEFPITKLTDPEWFTALILENRMLFAMNKTDLVTSLLPHYSLFGCMRKAKKLMFRLPPELENEPLDVTYVNKMRITAAKKSGTTTGKDKDSSAAHRVAADDQARDVSLRGIRQREGQMPGWKRRFVHVFFAGWGATVLAVHLRARQVALQFNGVVACKQQLRPWFASSFMCATYTFDCVEQGNTATLTASDLSLMDGSTLSSLIISNCPALEMPDTIQDFSGLLKFLMYNTTIVSWPSSASLNAESHGSLISINVVATNMSTFPDGLLGVQPDSLQDVQFAKTNLTTLPLALANSWRVSNIFFEYCEFTEFPTALLGLRVGKISLAGNKMHVIPDAMSNMQSSFQVLVLSGNTDLAAFPSSGLPQGVTTLSIENTAFTAVPASLTANASSNTNATQGNGDGNGNGQGMVQDLTIYAYNTPLCAAMGSPPSATSNTSSGGSVTVYCSTRDPSGVARFPLAWTIARYAPLGSE